MDYQNCYVTYKFLLIKIIQKIVKVMAFQINFIRFTRSTVDWGTTSTPHCIYGVSVKKRIHSLLMKKTISSKNAETCIKVMMSSPVI